MKNTYLPVFVCAAALACLPHTGVASGFSRIDAASSYLATAGAGQATDTSASAAFNNPAGLVGVSSRQLYSGAVAAYESFTFYDAGSEGVSPGFEDLRRDGVDYGAGWTGGPALHFATPISERLGFGVSMLSAWGGSSDFGESWVGSHFAEYAEVFSAQASASLGFRISDTLSVGASLGAQFLSWELNADLPPLPFGPVNPGYITPDNPMYAALLPPGSEERVKIDDVQPHWSLGIQWQPGPNTRMGLRYIPEINHELEGDAQILAAIPELTPVQNMQATMAFSTPSVTTLSVLHQVTPRLTLLADVEHTAWDVWNENRLVHENGATLVIDRDWQDTLGYSLGVEYRASDRNVLRAGFGYDESPIASNNLKIDPPMDRQIGYSLGLQSRLTDKLNLSLAYQYLDMGDIRVEQQLFPGQVIRGYSDADTHVFQAALTYRFE